VWTWGAPLSGSDCLLRRVLSSFNAILFYSILFYSNVQRFYKNATHSVY